MESAAFDITVVKKLGQQVKVARDELKNIRSKLNSLSLQHARDACRLESLIKRATLDRSAKPEIESSPDLVRVPEEHIFRKKYYEFRPIGYIRTVFRSKNATPRQPTISPSSKGYIELDKTIFTNPEHCLEGLEEFSHLWIVFIFHKNDHLDKGTQFTKSKVHPPRLDGRKLGVFATRSPYRPTPIGLSLVKIKKIEDGVIYLSGLDLVDGTPVLDIKPYIAMYDKPKEVTFRTTEIGGSRDTFLSKLERKETASIFEAPKPVTSREIMTEHKSLLAEIASLCAATANSILFKKDKHSFQPSKPSTSYGDLDDHGYKLGFPSTATTEDSLYKDFDSTLYKGDDSSFEKWKSFSSFNVKQKPLASFDRSEDHIYSYSDLYRDFSSSSNVLSRDTPYKNDLFKSKRLSSSYGEVSNISAYSSALPDLTTKVPSKSIWKDTTSDIAQISGPAIRFDNSRSTLSKMSGLSMSDTLLFKDDASVAPSWITDSEVKPLSVCFTLRAQKDLVRFHPRGSHASKCDWCFDSISSVLEAKRIISDVLTEDPRSVYRRKKCSDQLYYFTVDNTHVTCWFDTSNSSNIAEILRVFPASCSYTAVSK